MTTTVTQATDTRPRITYRLPNGDLVPIIHDHGQVPTPTITFTLKGGEIVEATLVPRKVLVRYLRADHGWTYEVLDAVTHEVLDAVTHVHLGGGWSAGKKFDAIDSFRLSAREHAWVLS